MDRAVHLVSRKTVEIFFTRSLKPKRSFDPNEIVNNELVDFKEVLNGVLRGDYVNSALVIATLLVHTKKLILETPIQD